MSLEIYLLGQFKLTANDTPVELPSRPAQSTLAYLALNAGVTHRREKLASLLWPEASESNARSYLRQALWRIRKSLESASLVSRDYLQISDISLCFNDTSDLWLDAEQLLLPVQHVPVEEIIEIINLYKGELLPGFYEEWVVLERERLGSVYHQKMNLLLERLVQAGQWNQVLNYGEQWIRLGHSPEPAYRALMSAHAGLGDQSMVSATYQRCMETLDRELGLEPSQETRRLYEKILLREVESYEAKVSHVEQPQIQLPSFLDREIAQGFEQVHLVAREPELSQLDYLLNLALKKQGRVVFVTGEVGSGKTALINEFTQRSQERYKDLIVAGGNCNAHTGFGDPYLPFREILGFLTIDMEARWAAGAITQEHARRLWNSLPIIINALVDCGSDLIGTFVQGSALVEQALFCTPAGTNWLMQLIEIVESKTTGSMVPGLQQSDLFEQYTRVLQTLARHTPLVLVLDDMQWADAGSVGLLFHLGRNLTGERILIVGAYRPEEVAIQREGERHPLAAVVNEFQREFGEILINVNQAEGRGFVEAFIDNEHNRLGVPFRQMLYQQTRGQPLFTIELLHGMQERGDLVLDQDDHWIEGRSLDWDSLPARVEAVIAERIDRLEKSLRTALRIASVEGEVFTAEVLARIQNADTREILAQLSGELDRKHRLIRTQSIQRIDGQPLSLYRFRHILFQKYLYSSMDEVERLYLHEQVGTILEGLYCTQENVKNIAEIAPRLARHFQEAKISDKALYYLHLAGENAVQMSAYKEARVQLTNAMALLMTLPASPKRTEQELDLQITLGMAWIGITGNASPEVERIFNRAHQLCLQLGETYQLYQVLLELGFINYVRAEYQKALELSEDLLNRVEDSDDPILLALGHWKLGVVLFAIGKYTASHKHLREVIDIYHPDQHQQYILLRGSDPGVSAMAYNACCLWVLGYPDQALSCSQQALGLARELDHPFSLADVLCYAGCMFSAIRLDAHSLKFYAEQLIQLANEKVPPWQGPGTWYLGEAQAMIGNFEGGIEQMHQGLALIRSLDVMCYTVGALGTLAKTLTKVGQPNEGLRTIAKALRRVDKTDERHWEAELYRIQAEILLTQGNESDAEVSLNKSIEVARDQSAKSWELRATTDLARLWYKQEKIDDACIILGNIYNWFTEGFDTPDLKTAKSLLDEM